MFSLLVVVTASATMPVFGEMITDPVHTIERIDTYTAVLLGGLTFVIATVGINIVANFISPAFDFSNVNPQKISWRMGGMIAAVGSVVLTPWNWYSNDEAIFWTLGILGALIGPLFGILIADFYLIRKQEIVVDDLYTYEEDGKYFYNNGVNPVAVKSLLISAAFSLGSVLGPKLLNLATAGGSTPIDWITNYSWFIGCGAGFVAYYLLGRSMTVAHQLQPAPEPATAPALAEEV